MLQTMSHQLGQVFEAVMEKRQHQIPDEGFFMTKKCLFFFIVTVDTILLCLFGPY